MTVWTSFNTWGVVPMNWAQNRRFDVNKKAENVLFRSYSHTVHFESSAIPRTTVCKHAAFVRYDVTLRAAAYHTSNMAVVTTVYRVTLHTEYCIAPIVNLILILISRKSSCWAEGTCWDVSRATVQRDKAWNTPDNACAWIPYSGNLGSFHSRLQDQFKALDPQSNKYIVL